MHTAFVSLVCSVLHLVCVSVEILAPPLLSAHRLFPSPPPLQRLDVPFFSAYSFLFSLTSSMYLVPNLFSSSTVTSTTGGFPAGTWFAMPTAPPRLTLALLALPLRVRSHIRAMRKTAPMATACCRYRRGRARRRLKGVVLVRAGRNGEGVEDFRGG